MGKLPDITTSEWLEAERQYAIVINPPQPKGSMTAEQYAEKKVESGSVSQARHILIEMHRRGILDRTKWCGRYVYFPKKKRRRTS